MNDDIASEIKSRIINRKIEQWKSNRYDIEIEARVAKRLGEPLDENQVKTQLARCEKWLDALREELAALATNAVTG